MTGAITRRTAFLQLGAGVLASCQSVQSPQDGASTEAGAKALLADADSSGAAQADGYFHMYASGERPLVMLGSGTTPPVPVLFDTGTSGSMVDVSVADLVKAVRKPNHRSFVTDASGTTIEAYAAFIPDMKIGSLGISRNLVDVYAYRVDDEAGIVGPNLFWGKRLYLNFPKMAAIVCEPAGDSVDIPDAVPHALSSGNGLPMIDICIDGCRDTYRGLIDSGKSGALSFPETMMGDLPLKAPPEEVGTATTVFKTVPVLGAQLDAQVRIGTHLLDCPEVIFHGDMPKVGLPVLRTQRLWIEPHRQRSWVARPAEMDQVYAASLQGVFGERTVRLENGALIYQRRGRAPYRLLYLGADHFQFDGDDTELVIRRDREGRVAGFTLIGADGRPYEVDAG